MGTPTVSKFAAFCVKCCRRCGARHKTERVAVPSTGL